MQFDLPRRQRKSFEVITKTALSNKLNKEQAIEVFNKIKKESVMELLVIVGNQIAGEYKDCEVLIKQGVPEINKIKS